MQGVLADLADRSGLERWVLARRDEGVCAVLAGVGPDPVLADVLAPDGRTLPWAATFCAARAERGAPAVATDVRAVPTYAEVAARIAPGVRAVVSVPVLAPDGAWRGELCGLGTQDVPQDLEDLLPVVRTQASLLGAVLSLELHRVRAERLAERATALQHADPLTGLGARRAWDAAVVAEEERAALLGTPAGLVVVDVVGLARLNAHEGHAAGDAALRRTVAVLLEAVAVADGPAGHGALVARLGGDEFGVLAPEVDAAGLDALVARVRQGMAAAGVAVSLGRARREPPGCLVEAWQRADAALEAERARADRGVRPPGRAARPTPAVPPDGLLPGPLPASADVDALLDLVAAQLGLDVAYVNERREDHFRIRNVGGRLREELHPGDLTSLDDSYCHLMLEGALDGAVTDASQDPRVAGLPSTSALGIGAWVGTPLRTSDGRVYGTLCAYSTTPEPRLDERDAGVLRVVGGIVMNLVEQQDRADQEKREVLERIDGLRLADGPRIAFQPVVALADGSVVGHEALSRFPAGTPDWWFAEARRAGVETELDLLAVRAAVAHLPRVPGFLSVNVSAATAGLPALARLVADAEPGRLVVELTEHTPVEDYDALRATLRPLRERGVRIAVDDVGAGFASMRHVLELLPDMLKLDISLVRNIATDPARQALATSMLAFAEATGVLVVAEGIETADELERLRSMGVALGQGFHLGRPAPLP
ncbi:EAL domain-containing protein [Cellulomonas endophytica]|uniref:EAL domain-containing protein n=1 Tax=Cellulomonas endophytica TaxID=2494735 RepID=UPI001F0C7CA1|nr:EAL domain-containing protein [Cellulomonas endophytica]